MTSPIAFPANIIGLMSGTSADGVDAAFLYTDGKEVARPGTGLFVPYSDGLRRDILALMRGVGDKAAIAHALTLVHIEAVQELLKRTKMRPDAIGFHGQTIRHAPHEGITEQIGDAALMAKTLGVPVVADFRTNDVKHGGQGAPLVPLYHAAICATLEKPVLVVNIGGVSNVTWIGEGDALLAFDSGVGNALLDDWVHQHTGARYDKDGALAAKGTVDEARLAQWMADPFFAAPVPKSLDRNHFTQVLPSLAALSVQDGAATLTAFTAAAIAKAATLCPSTPKQLLVTGGGRHNPTLMRMIGEAVAEVSTSRVGRQAEPRSEGERSGGGTHPAATPPINIKAVEDCWFNGDMLEAEAFAYLAARSMLGLPLSLPTTTGVKAPVTGGVVFAP